MLSFKKEISMQVILTSPYTLLLAITIITIWYYEKSEKLEYLHLPSSINDATIEGKSLSFSIKANPRAAIFYEVNGKKKSTIADYDGYAYIYHYFDKDFLEITFYEDKYKTEVKTLKLTNQDASSLEFKAEMVFDDPYYQIAKNTTMNYFIEDDYILIDIKAPKDNQNEVKAYTDYLIDEFKYSLDLLKEENGIYRTIYRINDQIVK